jgi:hypothetical protein
LSLIYVILRLLLYILSLNKYLNVKANNIKAAVEAFNQSNLGSNQRKANKQKRLEREQQGEVGDDVDVNNIKILFEERGHGWHMLEMEFEPTTETLVEPYTSNRTGRLTMKWTWRHKFTKELVHRYKTESGKSFDTGVLSGYLQSLRETTNKVAFERAKLVLWLNGKKSRAMDTAKHDPTCILNHKSLLIQWVSA